MSGTAAAEPTDTRPSASPPAKEPTPAPRRVLVVGSLPPPIAGQSLATEYLLTALGDDVPISVIDISDELEHTGGLRLAIRGLKLLRLPLELLIKGRLARGPQTVFYAQLGQSQLSMLRDLPLLAIARVLDWKMVGHLHGATWRKTIDHLPPAIRSPIRRSIAWFDVLLVLTPSAVGMFDGLVREGTIRVISNAVDPALEVCARAHEPLLNTPTTVLYLGNLIPGKGVEAIGDVARLAAANGDDTRFIVAGSGDVGLLGDITLTNCTYVGPVDLDQKTTLLKQADVLVLLSQLAEGQPISVLEAFHFGLPVVATANGGLADLISHDSGRIVTGDSPHEVIHAIHQLTKPTEWQRVSRNNRGIAQEAFSVERFTRLIRAVLLERRP